jgi:FdhD protein
MTRQFDIVRFAAGIAAAPQPDEVVIEQPLEIRVEGEPLAVAMRTPGHDCELAAGWLLSENVITSSADLAGLVEQPGESERGARVDAMLADPATFDPAKHRRALLSNASCGLCGAASIGQVLRNFPKIEHDFRIPATLLPELPARLTANQPAFQRTGGVHACALFDSAGSLIALREDVGRHNALDKLIGRALLDRSLPLAETVLLLSGRVSFEMVQKALAARIPIIAAIGAPSSLAVELARESGQAIVGFLRGGSFNLYSGTTRLSPHGAGGQ